MTIILFNVVIAAMLKPLSEMKRFIMLKVVGTRNWRPEKSVVKEISYLYRGVGQQGDLCDPEDKAGGAYSAYGAGC